jgi:hypothetical protein
VTACSASSTPAGSATCPCRRDGQMSTASRRRSGRRRAGSWRCCGRRPASSVLTDRLFLLCSGGLERSSERGSRSSDHRRRSESSHPSLMYRYFPSLLSLPVLLVVGIVFVVVPGGFIVVFAGAYYAAMGVIGYASLRVRERRQAARAPAHQANRRSSRQPGIRAPTPAAAVFRTLPGRQTVNQELGPVDDHVLARRSH